MDVREHPWSTDATVIVDVANVVHRVRRDTNRRLAQVHRRHGGVGDAPSIGYRDAARGLHRIVEVLEFHGIRTGRLRLGATLRAFPLGGSGWRAAPGDSTSFARRVVRDTESIVAATADALEGRGITVEGLPGLFGDGREHCIDELCVLEAAYDAWVGDGEHDVFVVSRDADVSVAPLMAGPRRIFVARPMTGDEVGELAERTMRHGADGTAAPSTPAYVRILPEAWRRLLLPEDLREGPARELLASQPDVAVPPVERVEVEGGHVLRHAQRPQHLLSSTLTQRPKREWLDRREALLERGVRSVAVVDLFGLLAAANRSGIGGRVPHAGSVRRALEELGLPAPLGQLAVVPDLLDADHGLIRVASRIGDVELVRPMQQVLTDRMRHRLVAMDDDLEAAFDSYDDGRDETLATHSQFARGRLSDFDTSAAGLEEKESAVLLAADLLWALVRTDGPVVLMTERPDLVVLLDLMQERFGAGLDMRRRVIRVGLHADPFTGAGIEVERSSAMTPWTTILLTGRMLVDLLRIEEGAASGTADGSHTDPTSIVEAVTYVPTIGGFTVRDLDGRPLGEADLVDVVQLPVEDLAIARAGDPEAAARIRSALARSLRMHLDLRVPLPRPQLTGAPAKGLAPATVLSARVIDHRDGEVSVRVTSDLRENELLMAKAPDVAVLPPPGSDVEIVIVDDGEHCLLRIPDLAGLADDVGRPRPARVLNDGSVEPMVPFRGDEPTEASGRPMLMRPLRGPYREPVEDDVVFVTAYDARTVQVVSTAIPWLATDPPVSR